MKQRAAPPSEETRDCGTLQRELEEALAGGLATRWRLEALLVPMLEECPVRPEPVAMDAGPATRVPQASEERVAEVCGAVEAAMKAAEPTTQEASVSRGEALLTRAPELASLCAAPALEETRQRVFAATRPQPDAAADRRLRLHHAWQGEVLPGGLGQPPTLPITLDVTCRPCPEALDTLVAQGLRPVTPPAQASSTLTRCATPEGWPVDCEDPYWPVQSPERRVLARHVLEVPEAGPPAEVSARFTGASPLVSTPPTVRFQPGFVPALPEEQVSPLFLQRLPADETGSDRWLAGLALVSVRRAPRVSVGSRNGAAVPVRHLLELDEAFRPLPPVEGRPFFVPFRLLLLVLETPPHDVPYSYSLRTRAPPGDGWLPAPKPMAKLHPELLRALLSRGPSGR